MTESRTIGDTRVDLLLDGVFETGREALIHQGGGTKRRQVVKSWGERPVRFDVNCFLLRGPDGIALVDAGTGPAWGETLGHARQVLAEAGITPAAVDRVFLTHSHGDHALGLLDGDTPFLPRADIFISAADLAFFTDAAAREAMPEARRGAFDIVARVSRAYGDRLKTIAAGPVWPGIEAIPLPGHTPGHIGYLIKDDTDGLLLWGDALHLADLQPDDPDAGLAFDLDPALAASTRRTILERAAAQGWVIGGSHVTGFRRVQRAGTAFRLTPV